MGDFEKVFGAGADADNIIDRYSREYSKATNFEKTNWFGRASVEKSEQALEKDEYEAWCTRVKKSGGSKGPTFGSYEELAKWDIQNSRPHIRRRTPSGTFQVFFTNET